MTTARGGAASLNTRLNTVESTVAGKASASSVSALEATVGAPGTGLLARTGAAENAIVSLQSGKADASRVTLLEASAAAAANGSALNKNSTFTTWPTGQTLPNNIGSFGSGLTVNKAVGKVSANAIQLEVASGATQAGVEVAWQAVNWNGRLPTANGQTSYWVIDYKIEVGTPNLGTSSLRFLLTDGSTGATASAVVQPLLSSLHTSTGDDQIVEGSYFFACSPNVAASFYSGRLAFFARGAAVASYGRYFVHKLAVRPATASEIESGVALPLVTSRVASLETATANLATGKADASRVTSLEATINTAGTGVTARLTTVESVAASADGRAKAIRGVVLDVNGYVSGYSSTNDGTSAAFEVSADKFGIRAPGSGERTEYRAGNWYVYSPSENTRTRYGKAFGGDQKLVWWTGPTSVAEGSETKGNAYVYMSQNTVGGPRFGGSDVIGPGGTLTATASTGFIGGGRSGAGYVNTSNQVTVTVSGGTSGATIRWTRISGDSRIQMNNATAFTTGAYATIGAGEVISAYFMGSITKGGQSAVVYVQVDLSDNGT